jgi:hypothetical protein
LAIALQTIWCHNYRYGLYAKIEILYKLTEVVKKGLLELACEKKDILVNLIQEEKKSKNNTLERAFSI